MSTGSRLDRQRSNLQLPKPPAKYDPAEQAITRQLIEQHWHPDTSLNATSQPALNAIATVTAADDNTVTVSVEVLDPYPQGPASLTLTIPLLHNVVSITVGGVTVDTSSSWDLASGDSVVFVIGRADPGGGEASVEWSIADKNQRRTPDFEAITIIEKRTATKWYNGTGAPSSGTGVDGDFYLDTFNGDVYTKTTGTWGVVANIAGPNYPVTVSTATPTGTPADGQLWIQY